MNEKANARGTIYQKRVEERVKQVLYMYLIEGKTVGEIGASFGLSRGTILTDINHRATILRRAGVISENYPYDVTTPDTSTEAQE